MNERDQGIAPLREQEATELGIVAGTPDVMKAAFTKEVDFFATRDIEYLDPAFSFRQFVDRFPNQRAALIDCLVGDVVNKDMTPFLDALAQMTRPPEPF